MKSWFNWRSLRRPKLPAARPAVKTPADGPITKAPLRLKAKPRPLWHTFRRKASPFELRPGAVESWMKARPAVKRRPARTERGSGDGREDIGGGR